MADNDNVLQSAEAVKLGLIKDREAPNVARDASLGFGITSGSMDAITPLVLPPAVIVVLHTPSFYNDGKNEAMGRMLKTLYERHAKTITGIDLQYNVETADATVGHDGQTFKVPTQIKRAEVSPSATFDELNEALVWRIHNRWARDLGDPDSNAFAARMEQKVKFMSSVFSMAWMVLQFDITYRPENLLAGYIISNIFPTDPAGAFGIERNIGQSKNIERSVSLTGYLQHTDATDEAGIEVAKRLIGDKRGANSFLDASGTNRRMFFDGKVDDVLADTGLASELNSIIS